MTIVDTKDIKYTEKDPSKAADINSTLSVIILAVID